jgi:cytochrome c peroxidase
MKTKTRVDLWLCAIFLLFASQMLQAASILNVNQELTLNQYLESDNQRFRFYLQSDGNLVLRAQDTGRSLWSSGTNGKGGVRLKLQTDGNMVLRNKRGSAVWSSKTAKSGGVRLAMQGDGNLVLYTSSGRSVWSTGTVQAEPADTTRPVITLNGSSSMSLNQGTAFTDPGATASDNKDGNITNRISVSGTVNSNLPGTYRLDYNVQDTAGNAASTVSRTVQVVAVNNDTLQTDQELRAGERLTSADGSHYLVMQGDGNLVLYSASGRALWATGTNGSGAIRARFQGDGNLVLRNSSGSSVWSSRTNGSGATRLKVVNEGNVVLLNAAGAVVWQAIAAPTQDTTRPVIRLNGATNELISQGAAYRDPGATASDNVDGDISNRIVVSGSVNTNNPGTYTLRYNVSDVAGNAAVTVSRTITVTPSQDDGGDPTPNPPPANDARSTGEFSSPNAALYSLNDSRSRGFPRVIDTGFSGNGHSETWDGRIFVRTRSEGWFASAFRPERIVRNSDGSVDFRQGAFGNSVALELETAAPDIQHNWLAIVPDHSVSGENPYPSNSSGSYSANGSYRTYRAIIYHTSKRNGDNDQMGLRKATFIVSNANTRDAQVVSARFTSSFERLRLQSGADFRCIEPSATMDGMLIICQGHPDNNGRIDNLVYSWNPVANATSNWRAPKSIANMYWDDRNQTVGGMPFRTRFPIAERPLLDATGNDYNRNELVKGAYPWVSHDGSELFFQASREGVSARRTATTVVGRWTGWIFRHIDGPINPYRHVSSRLFISSPGAFTTMWTPYTDVDDLKIPYSVRGPSYPIFGSNSRDYSEVGFDDYLDGNYVLYLGMNEQVDRGGAYQRTRTNDTSGNFNNGTLVGARFPLEYNNRDEIVGRYGQAIYFGNAQYVEVAKNKGWDTLDKSFSVDFWVRKLSGSGTIRLFNLNGGIEMSLLNGTTLSATITDTANTRLSLNGSSIATNSWTHVALTVDADTRQMKLYVNGREVASRSLSNFGSVRTSGSLRVGPESSTALMILDEVKVSNVARAAYEIGHYANVRTHKAANSALMNTIPSHLADLRFNATGVDNFSSAAASLGEQLFNDVILSKQRTTSCATCHNPAQAFTDGLAIAQGNEPTDAGVRNTPTILNRLFSSMQGWSGLDATLDVQALTPIQAPHEMNLPITEAVQRLRANTNYSNRFQQVFGQAPSAINIAQALASFQAVQFAPQTRVDSFLAGNTSALNSAEKRGLDLFKNKARCAGCHAGDNFTDESFRNNGLTTDQDTGRAEVTGRDRDFRLFKVPTLRELVSTAPYMHDGSLNSLDAVVAAYNEGGSGDPMVDTDIRPLGLSSAERNDLVAFLRALSAN